MDKRNRKHVMIKLNYKKQLYNLLMKLLTMKKATAILAMTATLAACNQPTDGTTEVIGKHNITVEDGRMSPEVLWSFGRLGDAQVSPDGK